MKRKGSLAVCRGLEGLKESGGLVGSQLKAQRDLGMGLPGLNLHGLKSFQAKQNALRMCAVM